MLDFVDRYASFSRQSTLRNEAQILGAIHGFLVSIEPNLIILVENFNPSESAGARVDMSISDGGQTVLMELKRSASPTQMETGVEQLRSSFLGNPVDGGILFLFGDRNDVYEITNLDNQAANRQILMVAPENPIAPD